MFLKVWTDNDFLISDGNIFQTIERTLIFNTFLSYFSSSGWHSKIRYGAAGSIIMNGTSVCKITIKYRRQFERSKFEHKHGININITFN